MPPLKLAGDQLESLRDPQVTPSEFAAYLALTGDEAAADDALLRHKLAAAESYIERVLGYRLADRFGELDSPAPIREATMMLAAHWYENREAAGETLREPPFGVREILTEYRDWTF